MSDFFNTLKDLFTRIPPYPYRLWENRFLMVMSGGSRLAFLRRVEKYSKGLPRSTGAKTKVRCFYSENLQVYSMADAIIDHNEAKGRYAVKDGGLLIFDPTFGGLCRAGSDGRYMVDRRLGYRNLELDAFELFPAVVEIVHARAELSILKPILSSEKFLALRDEKYGVTCQTMFLEKKLAELKGKTLF